MFDEFMERRPRRLRRRRMRSETETRPGTDQGPAGNDPPTQGTEPPQQHVHRPRPEGQEGTRRNPEGSRNPDGPRNSEGSRSDLHPRLRRPHPRHPDSNGSRENGSDRGMRRRRGRPEPRRSGGNEGIRDTTAHRIAAAEAPPQRRPGGRPMQRPGGPGRGGPAVRQERRRGLEILKLLQQQISIDPLQRYNLETTPDVLSMRVMDLIAPIGRGQRALIVSPPKAGKTTLLIQVSEALRINHPEVKVFALLVDERPEEVTHFRRSTHATIYAASSDMSARDHVMIAEECVNTIVEPVLAGEDVVLLLDSITRLARAYNHVQGNSGRTLSGGLDASTMLAPRQIFGAARKIEDGGSLTTLGTALVDTGSRMDEVIFQEFKGTGNTELVLSRDLFEKRIFPSVDIGKSGTRKEEKLYPPDVVARLHKLRRLAASYPADQAMLGLLKLLQRYPTNEEALKSLAAADA